MGIVRCMKQPRYNDLRYNDIFGLTIEMSLTEHKIFPVITIKSISQTKGNANIVNKKKSFTLTIIIINVSVNSTHQ